MELGFNFNTIILIAGILIALALIIFTITILRRYTMANFNFHLDEKVFLVTRQHKFLLFIRIVLWLVVAIIPLVIELALDPLSGLLGIDSSNSTWVSLKTAYWILAVAGLFIIFALYHLNVYIVTNKRLIDSDQTAITHHRVTEAHLDKVQDVAAKIKGIFGHIFNYGNVEIQSAGDIPKMTFENVGNPREVKRIVLDAHYEYINGGKPH